MADARSTLAAVLNMGDANIAFEVSDLLEDTPLLAAMAAVPSSHGHTHKYLKKTVAAGAGFRALGSGISNAAAQIALTTQTLKFLDASWEDDVILGKSMSTSKGGMQAYAEARTMDSTKAAFVGLEKQFIYGDQAPGSTGGFEGIADEIAAAMIVNKGGTTANVQTSVYLIRTGPTDAAAVYNSDDGGLIDVGDVRRERKADTNGNPLDIFRCPIESYLTLQAGNQFSLGRIANIETALDDDDIANAFSMFPAGQKPNIIAMNRDALKLLRQSRTATNVTGAPAPFPTEWEGIPIIVTDQIVSTEAVYS
jgi:hypothetical protein